MVCGCKPEAIGNANFGYAVMINYIYLRRYNISTLSPDVQEDSKWYLQSRFLFLFLVLLRKVCFQLFSYLCELLL